MVTKKQLAALARGRAIRAANIKKNKKVKCKRSKKRTGETIEQMIKRVSKPKKRHPIKNFLNTALKMGAAIGAGTLGYYGLSNPSQTLSNVKKYYKEYKNFYLDEVNDKLGEVIKLLESEDPHKINFRELKNVINAVEGVMGQNIDKVNYNAIKPTDLQDAEYHTESQEKWNQLLNWYDKKNADIWPLSKGAMINYLWWLREQYNKQVHGIFNIF